MPAPGDCRRAAAGAPSRSASPARRSSAWPWRATGGPVPLAVEGSDALVRCEPRRRRRRLRSSRGAEPPSCDPVDDRRRRRRHRPGAGPGRRAARRRADRLPRRSLGRPDRAAVAGDAPDRRCRPMMPRRPGTRGWPTPWTTGSSALADGPVDDVIIACWVRLEEAAAAAGVGPPAVGDGRRAGRPGAGQLRGAAGAVDGCWSCTGPPATPGTRSARTTAPRPSPRSATSGRPSGGPGMTSRGRGRRAGRSSATWPLWLAVAVGHRAGRRHRRVEAAGRVRPRPRRRRRRGHGGPAAARGDDGRGDVAVAVPARAGRPRASTTGSTSLETRCAAVPRIRRSSERRLRPLLDDLAAHRLRRTHGIDLATQPDAARRLLGDEPWALITEPADRRGHRRRGSSGRSPPSSTCDPPTVDRDGRPP